MFGDKMGNHRRSLVEVESPYFIFGGAVDLHQAPVLAHVLGLGFDQGVVPIGPSQPPEVPHELGEAHNVLSSRIASFYRRPRWARRT